MLGSRSATGSQPFRVAVFASQIFSAIVGISYVATRVHGDRSLRVIALRHPSFTRHHTVITQYLLPYFASQGIPCEISYIDDLPSDCTSLDLLVTPRIDHRFSLVCIDKVKPRSIVEVGESIGVEPMLYSYRYRLRRYLAIQAVRRMPFVRSIEYSHLVSAMSVNATMLEFTLQTCAALKRADLSHGKPVQDFHFAEGEQLEILLLPFLALPENKQVLPKILYRTKKRLGILGGYKRKFLPHPILKAAARNISESVYPTISSRGSVLYVKAHPKNSKHIDLIVASLGKMLGSGSAIRIRPLPTDLPLEEILIAFVNTHSTDRLRVFGFGTNLLSAMLILYPEIECVTLLHTSRRGIPEFLDSLFEFLFNRKELLRKRHVTCLIASLRSSLKSLSFPGPRYSREAL